MRKKIWEYKDLQEYKDENRDTFSKHEALLTKIGVGNDCIITFENPKCSEGHMTFVYVDGVITVKGDYGAAVFNWNNKNNHILAYGTFNSFEYILSKLEAVQKEGLKDFESDLFYKEFDEFIENKKECGYLEDIEIEKPYIESHCQAVEYMNENYELFGGDLESEDYELGLYVKEKAYLWWYGLQEALKQLKKQGAFSDKKDYKDMPYIKGFEPEHID